MPADEVLRIYKQLAKVNVTCWLEGGWAVDALSGRLHEHEDLDIDIELSAIDDSIRALEWLGYNTRHNKRPSKVDMRDAQGHNVTLCCLVFDDSGNAVRNVRNGSINYKAGHLTGLGVIDGTQVKCISAKGLLMRYESYAARQGRNDEEYRRILLELIDSDSDDRIEE